MKPMTDLGKITLNFAMAILREQEQHPMTCVHCDYTISAIEGTGVQLVHQPDCSVNFAQYFVDEFNKELVIG